MNPRSLALPALIALATVAVMVAALGGSEAPTPPPSSTPRAAVGVDRRAPEAAERPDERARQVRYRLSYHVTTTLDGRPGPEARVEGTWIRRPLRDGRQQVRLEAARIEGHDTLPPAGAMAAPVELAAAEGEPLSGMGFPADMPADARRLYTQLAAAFWYTDGPGDSWTVDEEDAAGVSVAVYRRLGEVEVERTVEAITALRGPDGLSRRHAEAVAPGGSTRFVFDDAGLAEVIVATRATVDMGEGTPRIETVIEGRLERIEAAPVAWTAGSLRIRPIEGHIDFGGQRAVLDDARVAGADLPELLAEVQRVGGLGDDREAQKWRSVTLRRLSALVRLDPATARGLADAIREEPDARQAGLMLGALGSAGTAAATDALAGLLDGELDPALRQAVTHHLALADAASPAAVEALRGPAEAGDPAAMAALGAQAGKLAGQAPEAAATAVADLVARYGEATTPEAKRLALMALGNSGAPEAMDILTGNLAVRDPAVADAAVFGLRFMPAGEADDILAAVLDRGDRRALAAVRAAAYRDPALWRDRLTAAGERFGEDARMARAIDSALARLD